MGDNKQHGKLLVFSERGEVLDEACRLAGGEGVVPDYEIFVAADFEAAKSFIMEAERLRMVIAIIMGEESVGEKVAAFAANNGVPRVRLLTSHTPEAVLPEGVGVDDCSGDAFSRGEANLKLLERVSGVTPSERFGSDVLGSEYAAAFWLAVDSLNAYPLNDESEMDPDACSTWGRGL